MLVSSIYSPYQVNRTTQNWATYFNRMSYIQNVRAIRQNSSSQAVGAIAPVPRTTSVTQTLPGRSLFLPNNEKVGQDSLDFLNDYQDQLRVLGNSAARVRNLTKEFQAKLDSAIQDKKIAEMSPDSKPVQRGNYEIDVKQLAQSQVSTLRAANGDNGSDHTFRDGTLQIEVNRSDRQGQPIRGEIQIDTQGKTNEQVQMDVVNQINAQSETLGLKASIVQDANKQPQIQIESKETGRQNAFTVTSADDNNKLEMNYEQLAQNLTYTVRKEDPQESNHAANQKAVTKGSEVTRESETNQAVAIDPNDNPDLKIDIKAVGKTQVKVAPKTDDLVKQTSDFVKEHNKTMDFLKQNTSRGVGVNRVKETMTKHINKLGKSMKEIGISANDDGTLSLDEKKFQAQLDRNADFVKETLERSNLADQAYRDTRVGLQQSSASLLSNDYIETTKQATAFNRYYVQGLAAVSASSPAYLFQNPLFFNLYI